MSGPGSLPTAANGGAQGCAACGAGLRPAPWVRLPYRNLYCCVDCSSLTALPRPSGAAQAELHGESCYFESDYFDKRRNPDIVEARCRDTFERIAGAMGRSAFAGLRHLDVGCDTGEFLLAAARHFQTQPFGIDVAPIAVEAARQRQLQVHLGDIESVDTGIGPFDLITAIDLVEHVPEPGPFFASAKRLLAPGGVLYLETPNPRSMVYRLGRRWTNIAGARPAGLCQRLFLHEHIQYFTPAGLARAAARADLEELRISTRRLAAGDIAASRPVTLALSALQAFDSPARGTAILTWGVFVAG